MRATSSWTRRQAILAGVSAAGLGVVVPRWSALASGLSPTPRQGAGPFYPDKLPLDDDNDLVTVKGQPRMAKGEVVHVFGRVLDETGRALSGFRVEIWQCDAFGVYHHPREFSRADPGFQGFGHTVTDGEGGYRFRTIKPVPYTGRVPHIHFGVRGPGVGFFTTQMYLADYPDNERDFIFGRMNPRTRPSVLVKFAPAAEAFGAGAVAGRFDIVLAKSLFSG